MVNLVTRVAASSRALVTTDVVQAGYRTVTHLCQYTVRPERQPGPDCDVNLAKDLGRAKVVNRAGIYSFSGRLWRRAR